MNKPLSQAMAWCETLAARMPGCHPAIQPFVIPPSPRSNPSAIFCKRISYRF
jgi:triosephosphate isomerase